MLFEAVDENATPLSDKNSQELGEFAFKADEISGKRKSNTQKTKSP
jgi:hypothetical protein